MTALLPGHLVEGVVFTVKQIEPLKAGSLTQNLLLTPSYLFCTFCLHSLDDLVNRCRHYLELKDSQQCP